MLEEWAIEFAHVQGYVWHFHCNMDCGVVPCIYLPPGKIAPYTTHGKGWIIHLIMT